MKQLIKKNLFVFIITIGFSTIGYAQYMNMEFKKLKNQEELAKYLSDNHGKLVENSYFKHCRFFECDNNTLIIENLIEKKATLYYDRRKYYQKMDEIKLRSNESPLKSKQELISNIEANKNDLLRVLFVALKFKQPEELTLTNLKDIDTAIKAYGYKKSFDELYLNMIVFAGEYIRKKRGGYWIAEGNISYPSELMPLFIDGNGKKYDWDINTQIQKEFLEKGRFSIEEIINYAMLPELKVHSPGKKGTP